MGQVRSRSKNVNRDHKHCPYDCEHPQPFILPNGREVCGKHWWDDNELVDMIPCNEETCPDELG